VVFHRLTFQIGDVFAARITEALKGKVTGTICVNSLYNHPYGWCKYCRRTL